MFPSLCSWWFSCETQGTSSTLKKHLKLPHPSQALLATKGICHIKFFIFFSVKVLVQLNFTWLLNWKAKRKNKENKTNLGVLWPSVTSTSPKENVSSFVVIPYLSTSRVQSWYFLLSLLPRTPSWSMIHNRYSINTCWMTERMLFNLSVPVFLWEKKGCGFKLNKTSWGATQEFGDKENKSALWELIFKINPYSEHKQG